MQQINGRSDDELEDYELAAIDLSMASAEWIVDMAEYISQNPTFLVNGFIKSGITGALEGISELEAEQDDESEDDSSADKSEDDIIIEL